MNKKNQQLDDIFFALSDHRRRNVLEKLSQGPKIIKELSDEFNMSKPAVGKHVKILEKAGLIKRLEKGRVHECRLDSSSLKTASQWIDQYQNFWQSSLAALASYAETLKKK